MASGHDNTLPLADGARLALEFPSIGPVAMRNAKSYNVNRGGQATVQVGPNGVLGTTKQAGGIEISITFQKVLGSPVDFARLKVTGEQGRLDIQIPDGPRHSFTRVTVSTANLAVAEDGQNTEEVTFVAEREVVVGE
jgi:hypothetical protein